MLLSLKLLIIIGALLVIGVVIAIAVSASSKKKAPVVTEDGSYFDGNTFQLLGYRILVFLVTALTLGIAYPWMLCMMHRWEAKHSVIHGRRLKFNGHGHQLIGRYLLWLFLTIITLGIYSIWFGLGMKKWVTKHTVYADEEEDIDSYFSGGPGGYLGIHILSFLITVFTLGIGYAWGQKMVLAWETRHTHIGGSPLVFYGTGGQLFVKYLLFVLLTPLTLGIYALFFPVRIMKWKLKNTEAVYQTPEIQAKAHSHEGVAVQDYSKYRLAANDQEIAAMKSGFNGREDRATLEAMAADNNPYAAYALAKLLRGDAPLYEGKALELLQVAADGKVHSALFDMAQQCPAEQKLSLLTEAAQSGNADASMALARACLETKDLPHAAYWFKVAMEWGIPQATAASAEYERIVKHIALDLSESHPAETKNTAVIAVVAVLGAVLLIGGILVAYLFNVRLGSSKSPAQDNEIRHSVTVYSSLPAEAVHGEPTTILGEFHQYSYILNDEVFYDWEAQALYFEFAYGAENQGGVLLEIETVPTWRSEIIPVFSEAGVYRAYFPEYMDSLQGINVIGDNGSMYGEYLKYHPVELLTGDSNEASLWLEAVIDPNRDSAQNAEGSEFPQDATFPVENDSDSYTEEPTESQFTSLVDIVGDWYYYDMYTHLETGDDVLEIWNFSFHPDGTVSFSHQECMLVPYETDIFYGPGCWMAMGGAGFDGTFTLNGTDLTIQYHSQGEFSELQTLHYTMEFLDGCLSIYSEAWGRTRNFMPIWALEA